MDRNTENAVLFLMTSGSLSARRAWIEIQWVWIPLALPVVALRKESVDRNTENAVLFLMTSVALRKESVDRNCDGPYFPTVQHAVALRKESVDRNIENSNFYFFQISRSPQGERG